MRDYLYRASHASANQAGLSALASRILLLRCILLLPIVSWLAGCAYDPYGYDGYYYGAPYYGGAVVVGRQTYWRYPYYGGWWHRHASHNHGWHGQRHGYWHWHARPPPGWHPH